MPRVRIPNASLIASADPPVLPFLAPRVFTESPVLRRRQHGKQRISEEEEAKTVTCREATRLKHEHAQWRDNRRSCFQYAENKAACGLLQASGQRRTKTIGSPLSTSVEKTYADISTFARMQARSYFTYTKDSVVRRVESTSSQRRQRRTCSPRILSVSGEHSKALALKRQKALALERKRFANYISRQPGVKAEELLKQGQYRSLRRRILNLEHWDATKLDLRIYDSASARHFKSVSSFAALDRTTYPSLAHRTRKLVINHDPRCVQWSNKLFRDADGLGWHQLLSRWTKVDVEFRRRWACRLLIYLLDRKPDRALAFIQILANDPTLQRKVMSVIADGLGHLSRLHVTGSNDAKQGNADLKLNKQAFVPAFVSIFRRLLSERPDVCSQDLLYNIVGIATTEDLKNISDCLFEHRAYLGFDTLLHYASAFGEAGELRHALRCLDELKARYNDVAWPTVVDRQRLRWTCAVILRKSMSQSQMYHETPEIVAAFVRLGIKMDLLLYNVVMRNAMDAGDYAIAFKVYNALEGNGLKPDKHTFSILLNGCTMQNNPAMFHDFAEHCAEVAIEMQDPWLATDYLYYSYIRHQDNADTERTLTMLWQKYLRLFSATPLEPFISYGRIDLRQAIIQQRFDTERSFLKPTNVALYTMLQAEIQSAAATSNLRVSNLYQQFKLLATQGTDQSVRDLAESATIWNAFLFAFCSKNQFASASQLIKDMTEGPVAPNVYSWNIFMQAFFKTGQVQAADRVFEIMRSRGVDPDQFSYGVLLRGYAKAQHIDRVVETMEHLKTDDELDPDLLRALASVANRTKLMRALEKSRLNKEERAATKAEQKAEEEILRWASALAPDFATNTPRDNRLASSDKQSAVNHLGQPGEESSSQSVAADSASDVIEHRDRTLQEQTRVATSNSYANAPTTAGELEATSMYTFGASLGSKSKLSNSQEQTTISKVLPRINVRKVLAGRDSNKQT